jgi:uncharacterized RDD family membrane protein YckC
MDPQQGIICGLTGRPATFENTCPTFVTAPGYEAPNPYEPKAFDAELVMATGTRRFINYLIDVIAYYLLAILAFMALFIFLNLFYPEAAQIDERNTPLWAYVFALLVFTSYYVFCESVFGRTLGKLITGTRVVNKFGKTPDTKTILLRTLSRMVPFEAFSFLGSDPRGWHDRWTDTYVVMK